MSSLELKHIYKRYSKDVTAVKDFNLKINDKEFIVFVGPSGCGKSTTLRMVAGLEEISDGELYIDGTLVNNLAPKDRDIAMVFQNYALYPHMTVYDNIAFGLKLRKVPKSEIDIKVKEAANILGIEDLLKRKPKALSGGQRQRVAMGRAIVRDAKVFLLDEPLSNLDAKLRNQMRIEIAKLHQSLQTTFIYVTHDQTEAMTLGTKIVVMKDGIIQQVDTPSQIYNNPANIFVAGFIGSPQMNFFSGKIKENAEGVVIEALDTEIKLGNKRSKYLKENDYIGKDVVLGVRSEDIKVSKIEAGGNLFELSGSVEVVENLGSEVLLHVKVKDKDFTIKSIKHGGESIGDNIRFLIDSDKMHLFDKESEDSIF